MGKKLSDYLKDFEDATDTTSTITRNLALAAIVLIWVFKNPEHSITLIPKELIRPLFVTASALILDLLQYIWKSIAIWCFYNKTEKILDEGNKLQKINPEDILAPSYISNVAMIFFIGKIALTITTYLLIFIYIWPKLWT